MQGCKQFFKHKNDSRNTNAVSLLWINNFTFPTPSHLTPNLTTILTSSNPPPPSSLNTPPSLPPRLPFWLRDFYAFQLVYCKYNKTLYVLPPSNLRRFNLAKVVKEVETHNVASCYFIFHFVDFFQVWRGSIVIEHFNCEPSAPGFWTLTDLCWIEESTLRKKHSMWYHLRRNWSSVLLPLFLKTFFS